MPNKIIATDDKIFKQIKNLLNCAKSKIATSINTQMVQTYFEIGKIIVEYEQDGKAKAEYGKATLKELSARLASEFGKGFSVRNLERMRLFYIKYSKTTTVSTNSQNLQFSLSWSHYVELLKLDDLSRKFYEIEAIKNYWGVREMNRQILSSLFERLAISKNDTEIKKLSSEGQIIERPDDVIKEPYVLEFLDLEHKKYSENELEEKIIDNLESFLLELGKGFSFVGRQKRFSFENDHFYVDLVFYNRLLKCFVLIDLKLDKLKHQDLGQMQMYVNYYDRFEKLPEENPTIGILLCKKRNKTIVEMTLPEKHNIYAKEYQLYLPSKEQFEEQINKVIE
jgi:predicted nuclease of restriction endonuclease-like (RecB) superfamily